MSTPLPTPLPIPADALRPLVEPAPPGWLAWTPGVAAVAVIVATALLWALARAYRNWRANAYRRRALRMLDALCASAQAEPREHARAVSELLKRTAIAAAGRERVAPLHGEAWTAFLRSTCPALDGAPLPARHFADLVYRRDATLAADERIALERFARTWIATHRVNSP